MSSDLSLIGGSFFSRPPPEMVERADLRFFFDPPFSSPLCDESIDDFCSIDQLASILSSSPPSNQFQNLVINSNLESNGLGDFTSFNCSSSEVKNEEAQPRFDFEYNSGGGTFAPHSYSSVESLSRYLQRSFSSSSFDGNPNSTFHPLFDSLMESQSLDSPENRFFAGQMRRVYSTGDLQSMRNGGGATEQRSVSSPVATEEGSSKVARYSAEERKERISKYRAKRNQRNFNKTIKYACRKTLADNRPRIRGRFARNDEIGEIPKASSFSGRDDEEEDDLWYDGMNEIVEDDGQRNVRGFGINSSGYSGHQAAVAQSEAYAYHYHACFQ